MTNFSVKIVNRLQGLMKVESGNDTRVSKFYGKDRQLATYLCDNISLATP